MDELTRREAIGAGGGLALAALAGCVGSGGNGGGGGDGGDASDQPRLDRVRVENARDGDVSLDLQLELDDEVVFWEDVDVTGTDGSEGTVGGPTFTPPAFPRERGEWRVRARVREGGQTYSTVFNSETTAESCLALGVTVRDDDVEITYVATHDCEDAPAATTQS